MIKDYFESNYDSIRFFTGKSLRDIATVINQFAQRELADVSEIKNLTEHDVLEKYNDSMNNETESFEPDMHIVIRGFRSGLRHRGSWAIEFSATEYKNMSDISMEVHSVDFEHIRGLEAFLSLGKNPPADLVKAVVMVGNKQVIDINTSRYEAEKLLELLV